MHHPQALVEVLAEEVAAEEEAEVGAVVATGTAEEPVCNPPSFFCFLFLVIAHLLIGVTKENNSSAPLPFFGKSLMPCEIVLIFLVLFILLKPANNEFLPPSLGENKEWFPCTKLGRLVKDGMIKKIEEIYLFSLPIKESEIIDFFLGTKLKDEVSTLSPSHLS